jgi:hypothetical protein
VTRATAEVTGEVDDVAGADDGVWLTVAAAADPGWLSVEGAAALVVTGAAGLVPAETEVPDVVETAGDEAGLAAEVARLAAEVARLAAEVAGAVTRETADATPSTVLVTAPVTAPSTPPEEEVGVEAAEVVVDAWALVPDSSQKMAISPKQQPRSTVLRPATRPAQPWPGVTCASGAA